MMTTKQLGTYAKGSGARAKIEYLLEMMVPSKADYYLNGGEPAGRWVGSAAKNIGLDGDLMPNQLHGLMQGFDPRSYDPEAKENEGLIKTPGPNRRTGFDLTFSCPKSVSVAFALETPENQEKIRKAFNSAVDKALERMEKDLVTRRGKDGKEVEPVEGVFVAVCEHSTARVPDMKDRKGMEHLASLMNGTADPHLHAHAIVSNVCQRKDGSFGTIENSSLFDNQKLLGAIFHAELAKGLKQELGYSIAPGKAGAFELEGVDEKTITHFSKRHVVMQEWLKVHAMELAAKGITGRKAEDYAWARTRKKKDSVNRPALFAEWKHDAEKNLDIDIRSLSQEGKQGQGFLDRMFGKPEPEFDLKAVIEKAAQGQSVFDISKLEAELWVQSQFHDFDVKEKLREALDSEEIILLKDKSGKLFGVTKEIREMEMTIARATFKLKDDIKHRTSEHKTKRVVDKFAEASRKKAEDEGWKFNEQVWDRQRQAVEDLTMKTGRIALLKGLAGAGKTTVMTCVRQVYEEEGFRVIGCALAGKAAENLQNEAGIKSNTIQGLLARIEHGHEKLTPQHVIVVDEAGMVDTRLMHGLVQECIKSGAKLIVLGEAEQLQPIGAGGPFRLIEKVIEEEARKNGDTGIQVLGDIIRQKDSHKWLTEAILDVRNGDAEKGLRALADHGLLSVVKDNDQAMTDMVNDWKASSADYKKKLMIAGTRSEVDALNAMARQARRTAGELGAKDCTITVKAGKDGAVVDKQFSVGDRIVFTKKDKNLGKTDETAGGVQNGYYGTILEIKPALFGKSAVMKVLLDNGKTIEFDTAKKIELAPRYMMKKGKLFQATQYNDIDHAYAITVHKSQGQTVENCFVKASDRMTDREWGYVALSRSKGATKLYATEEQKDDLADMMNRSRIKGTSLDYEAVDKEQFRTGESRNLDLDALLDAQAKTRYQGKIESLTQAITWGDGDDVRRMLADPKQKAMLDQADQRGNTPLHLAVYKKNPEAVKALLEAGATVDVGNRLGLTPLHDAIRAGNPDVVRMLVERGADPFRVSKSGDCPFKLASDLERRSADVAEKARKEIERLGQAGIGGTKEEQEEIAHQIATLSVLMGNSEKENRSASAMVSVFGQEKTISLEKAVVLRSNTAIREILADPARKNEVTAKREDGKTALHLAARTGNAWAVKALVAAGADVKAQDGKGIPVLTEAIRAKKVEIVRELLEAGADPLQKDARGNSPVRIAHGILKQESIQGSTDGVGAAQEVLSLIDPPKPEMSKETTRANDSEARQESQVEKDETAVKEIETVSDLLKADGSKAKHEPSQKPPEAKVGKEQPTAPARTKKKDMDLEL